MNFKNMAATAIAGAAFLSSSVPAFAYNTSNGLIVSTNNTATVTTTSSAWSTTGGNTQNIPSRNALRMNNVGDTRLIITGNASSTATSYADVNSNDITVNATGADEESENNFFSNSRRQNALKVETNNEASVSTDAVADANTGENQQNVNSHTGRRGRTIDSDLSREIRTGSATSTADSASFVNTNIIRVRR